MEKNNMNSRLTIELMEKLHFFDSEMFEILKNHGIKNIQDLIDADLSKWNGLETQRRLELNEAKVWYDFSKLEKEDTHDVDNWIARKYGYDIFADIFEIYLKSVDTKKDIDEAIAITDDNIARSERIILEKVSFENAKELCSNGYVVNYLKQLKLRSELLSISEMNNTIINEHEDLMLGKNKSINLHDFNNNISNISANIHAEVLKVKSLSSEIKRFYDGESDNTDASTYTKNGNNRNK